MNNSPQLWQKEYKQKGIPSSFRKKSSGSLKILYEWLVKNKIPLKNKIAADLGCGTGRNSFSLIKHGIYHVYAIDFVPKLIAEANERAKIIFVCHDLTKSWPIPTNSLDLIIDIFCFKHQTEQNIQKFYKNEIVRTLKPNGILLISLADIKDGYYGNLPKIKIKKDIFKITDPKTNIPSLLFSKQSLIKEFTKNFTLKDFRKEIKKGKMHGRIYDRITLKFIFQKN